MGQEQGETLAAAQYKAAVNAVENEDEPAEVRAEMLMEIALGLQLRPKHPQQLRDAVELYERALALCPDSAVALRGRIRARMGTALQALPEGGRDALLRARDSYEQAQVELKGVGTPEELAEIHLNLGLVHQSLVATGNARIHDAIGCYQNALRVFTRESHAKEYAILHNNLAIAYLSIPLADERARMREALAVQSFEEVLKVITLVDHPSEYAMIQNNLGNALQYATSGHPLQNNLRALEAYDAALEVRNARDTPLEYANTIANKANVLRNLPDDVAATLPAGPHNLRQARDYYAEAHAIFQRFQQTDGADRVAEMLHEIDIELQSLTNGAATNGAHLDH
jgi:tetratricopeptide (TPR) repeat protein